MIFKSFLLMVIISFFLTSSAHAILSSDVGKIHGEVVKINVEENEITIKDFATEKRVILKTPNGLNKDITVGKEVAATYDLGSNSEIKSLRFIKIIDSSY